jgi:hypothetical protein
MAEKSAGQPEDETKRKFREALERKKQAAQSRPDHLDGGSITQHARGKAGGKREFRRKSG